jgi:hypothetical protein
MFPIKVSDFKIPPTLQYLQYQKSVISLVYKQKKKCTSEPSSINKTDNSFTWWRWDLLERTNDPSASQEMLSTPTSSRFLHFR